MQDHKSFSKSRDTRLKYNNRVKTIGAEEATSCKFVKDIIARDNFFDTGEEYAILYLKVKAYEKLEANAVTVDKVKKEGDYGHLAFGKAYNCPSPN